MTSFERDLNVTHQWFMHEKSARHTREYGEMRLIYPIMAYEPRKQPRTASKMIDPLLAHPTAANGARQDPGGLQDRLQELPEQQREEAGPAGYGEPLLWPQDVPGEQGGSGPRVTPRAR